MAVGRPSKYEEVVKPKLKFIKSLVKDGFTQKEIAEFLGINEDTLYEYKKRHIEFAECLEKEDIINEVEKTYINRLLGKYRATKEVFERKLNETTNEYEMVLSRIEKYEIPFNDGAYSRYLAIMRPEKWGMSSEDKAIMEDLKNGVKLNIVNGNDDDRT